MRDANKRAGPDLKAVHPLGKSPTVTIRPAGSEKDIVITESETIMEYICDHFGQQLVPKRYPEGQEGVLGAETEEWMRYKVGFVLIELYWNDDVLDEARGVAAFLGRSSFVT